MYEVQIQVSFDPKQTPNVWKVSYGEPVGCFRVSKKHTALHYAIGVAKRSRPSRIIVQNQKGSIEKQIKYPSRGEENFSNILNRYLFELASSDIFLSLPVAILVIGFLVFVAAPVYLSIFIYQYLRQQTNRLPSISVSFNRVRGGHYSTQKISLKKPPGAHLLALVDFLFSPKTVELTFKQLVADWRTEYFEALKQGRTVKAHWIMVRYRVRFACAFVMSSGVSNVVSLFKQIK